LANPTAALADSQHGSSGRNFSKISGGRNAGGGFGHQGGDLASRATNCGAKMVCSFATSDSTSWSKSAGRFAITTGNGSQEASGTEVSTVAGAGKCTLAVAADDMVVIRSTGQSFGITRGGTRFWLTAS
jgi:hypothetical protein